MNRRMVLKTVGQILLSEAGLLLLPLAVSLYYKEKCVFAFLITILIAFVLGGLLAVFMKPATKIIYAKEGFVTVSLAWIILSVVGALPFVLSGEIPSFADAFFETVSGFTTTGASVVQNVEIMSKGILFWRSFTHWVGGMGILVFIMAILPNVSDRSIHIMRAEMPGPIIGKLVPKAKDTAKILYLIYIAMTTMEILILRIEGMTWFESAVHSFGTAGTGGFGIKADGLASYSPVIQYTIAIFMLLFGINFNLYYLLLLRKVKSVIKSGELWFYLGVVLVSVVIVSVDIYSVYGNISDVLRLSLFQISSIVTTTGYATADFNTWPVLSKGIILLLMFFGGCAGSTAGGFKMSRVILLFKTIKRELKKLLHPRSVSTVRLEGKPVSEETLTDLHSYFAVYIALIGIIFIILCFGSPDIETAFSSAVSCFNNVGPAFSFAGPTQNYAFYSDALKYVLSFAMLLGRLEIFPILLTFSFSTWSKK